MKFATFHIKQNVATTSLQNINWLPASKKVWAAYIKEKISIVTVCIPSPYNVFLYFLKGQLHKENKLGKKEIEKIKAHLP